MTKIDEQAEKQTLLAKMDVDRAQLTDALTYCEPRTQTSKGWTSTAALAAGAAVGWPRFLRKPLRAMAMVAIKNRVSEMLQRRSGSQAPRDPELERLAQLAADLRHAVAQAERVEDVERVRRELDEQVRRVREQRAREALEHAQALQARELAERSAMQSYADEVATAPDVRRTTPGTPVAPPVGAGEPGRPPAGMAAPTAIGTAPVIEPPIDAPTADVRTPGSPVADETADGSSIRERPSGYSTDR